VRNFSEGGIAYYIDTDTTDYNYDTNGKLTNRTLSGIQFYTSNNTILQEIHKTIDTYTYNGSIIINRDSLYSSTNSNYGATYDTILQSKANGNVISEINSGLGDVSTFSFTLDTHPNPIHSLAVWGQSPIVMEAQAGYLYPQEFDDGAQINNCTQVNVTNSYDSYIATKNVFVYSPDGNPVSFVNYSSRGSGSALTYNYKGIFVY
jgi:hypothetical protein